jgi:hypothetical protein
LAKIYTKNGVISSSAAIDIQVSSSGDLFVSGSGVGIHTITPSSSLELGDGYILLPEETVIPDTPGSGKGALYATASNNHIYWKTSGGEEFDLTVTGAGAANTDETVKVSANDTTAGYLNGKLVAGTNITVNERNDGANETFEITASLGGRYDHGTSSTNPASPTPVEGDKYYNTVIEAEMRYDGSRSKWLSIESSVFNFGKTGNNAVGAYFKGHDGVAMSATSGFPGFHSGTIVAVGYTRSDSDAAVFQITADGTEIAFISSSAVEGVDTALDADFAPDQVLGVLNKTGGNTVSNVVGWAKVKWRF